MGIELLIGNELGTKAYLPAVEEGIEWTTERKGAPGKLSFKVLWDDVLDFSEGSAVRMKENGEEVFFGFVFKQQRSKEQLISVTAYDQLRYLKNKDTIVYENKTADQFLRMLHYLYCGGYRKFFSDLGIGKQCCCFAPQISYIRFLYTQYAGDQKYIQHV